ncbi:hypothetical protein I302_100238 [Kwoniella bestiolae CBS 10118]|uniref:N-acetyltransferase domain-containing protein n=1 Tax=Kwoniella bestiolae CBS 10118 TaxID=1296100 RepID=A0A1B9G4J1_9TREE|nr:hypothetical protein I302_03612 [Kwoniella bestiolae CBS 10118]OCF25936.1 hypothetical protein I302_03612 [Kwoniella bestiolae CBS 10118]
MYSMKEDKQIELVQIVRPTDEERERILEIIEVSFKDTQMNKFIFGDDLATQRLFHLRKLGGAFDPDPSVHQDKQVEGCEIWVTKLGGEVQSVMVLIRPGQSRGDSRDKMEYERTALARLPEEKKDWIKNERKVLSKRAEQSAQFEIKQAFNLEIIATHPSARRHGLGTMLIRKLISLLTNEERHIWLTSTHDTAVEFYKKLGFNVVFEDVIHFGEEQGRFRAIAYELTSECTFVHADAQ